MSFRIVTREWLGLALCNALELSIYGFLLISLCCLLETDDAPVLLNGRRYAEDMFAPAFIPGVYFCSVHPYMTAKIIVR